MEIGAVIVAAGMSTRMVQFKQLMKIGNRTMAERVVVNFQQAGVKEIVMVTGYRSEQLEKELRGFGITFLKNSDYETTQMFESAKMGLAYLQGRCDRVLFCPVDIPFFMEKTVRALLEEKEGDVVVPVYGGKSGHPILIRAALIPKILEYRGDGGLKGALQSIENLRRVRVLVQDEAILMDADTKEDFQRLVDLHNARLMHVEVGVTLVNQKPFLDRGTVQLLRLIAEIGSVREACERMGISYSKGWSMIQEAEDGFGCRIVERQAGGKHGGTASVTLRGLKWIQRYEYYEEQVKLAAEKLFAQIFLESDLF